MPAFLLENKPLKAKLKELAEQYYIKSQESTIRQTSVNNPQTIHKKLKEEIVNTTRQHTKCITAKIDRIIASLEENRQDILNNKECEDTYKGAETAIIDERIKTLKRSKMMRMRDNTDAKFFIEGEVLRKTWIDANKDATQRDVIAALHDESRPNKPLTRRSDVMANIMRKFHDDLQSKDPILDPRKYKEGTKTVLNHIRKRMTKEQSSALALSITRNEVEKAMKSLPNGKSAGPDGIPQEIWKDLLHQEEKSENETDENITGTRNTSDISDYFTILFNDIEEHGIEQNTNFAEGWLCPIYKKGDCTDAGNYRPITVLNSDYKTFTKALTNRLSEVTPDLIHPDQAGFMKG